jgi:proliferating cell nuclear antigen
MDSIKDLLVDTTMSFSKDGIKLVALDNTHVVMIHLKLDAKRFEEFYCDTPVSIGVNLANFQKLLKTVNTSDTLTLFLEHNDRNRLGIRVENEEKHTKTEFKMNLLDLDSSNFDIPPLSFNSCIMLPSAYFQKIIRDMASISEKVELKNVGKQFSLTCCGDFCSQETILKDTDQGAGIGDDPLGDDSMTGGDGDGVIVQGMFSLRYLVLFTKCSALCQTVELFMKSDFPLIVNYNLALGSLKLCLSPMCEDI